MVYGAGLERITVPLTEHPAGKNLAKTPFPENGWSMLKKSSAF
jgi:hypothetical protein